MKSRKIKTEISAKLKNVCEELSEKERKGTQKELPFVHPVDSLHRADKDSIMYHPKTNE